MERRTDVKPQNACRSIGAAVALACLAFSPAALADRKCSGTIGPVTINDNVVVQNASCTLNGTNVKGNVLVYSGGRLTTLGAQVDGNIQAKGAIAVTVEPNTFVDGDIQLENLSGPFKITYSSVTGNIQLKYNRRGVTMDYNTVGGDIQFEEFYAGQYAAYVRFNTVDGNVQMTKNRLTRLNLVSNRVNGDMQAFENRTGTALVIRSNNIRQNLQCKGNYRAPTGGGNIVRGSKEDQCRML
jgi:hypothetical protein